MLTKNIIFKLFQRWIIFGIIFISLLSCISVHSQDYPFQNPDLDLDTRVEDLLTRLSISEKIALLHQWQPAIPRLGIDSFRTGTEGLHGIAWLGKATVFPQSIGLGSSWDTDLLKAVGSAVGDEARAKHYEDPENVGLSIWAPVVDLLRDPRAGRGEEGFSEDPYLTGQMSLAYARGLKGDDPFYYKTIPTLKHFYAYNQEERRVTININIDDRNRHEYYLEAFRYAIQGGAAKSMMTAYNLVNGIPCTVHPDINEIVKSQWIADDFFVVTDAYAPGNLIGEQRYFSSAAQSHAAILLAGVDSLTQDGANSRATINNITQALDQGLISEADINKAVKNILKVRFHTGEFDGALNPYADINSSEINHPDHQALAREAVRKSIVLLKNNHNLLPINTDDISSIAVIGEKANTVLTDWYSGDLPYSVTPLKGIQNRAGNSITVSYSAANPGIAASADLAIVFLGNDPTCGGAWGENCGLPSEGKEPFDRSSINLEPSDLSLLQQVYSLNPNSIFVLIASFPYAINWAQNNIPSIIYMAHGGQESGNGLADVLFGDYSPAGRLTTTWYSSLSQLPAKDNYDIINNNRTYMYFNQSPLYSFGHGLSYGNFIYSDLELSDSQPLAGSIVDVSFTVRNNSTIRADEVVQLYVHDQSASVKRPQKELLGFKRITLEAGQSKSVVLNLYTEELAYWDSKRDSFYIEPGYFDIMVASSSQDIRLSTTLNINGGGTPLITPIPTPTPQSGILGDVNFDSMIDIIDSLIIAQHYVGLEPAGFHMETADVNCSSTADIVDALLVAQYYVKLINALGC